MEGKIALEEHFSTALNNSHGCKGIGIETGANTCRRSSGAFSTRTFACGGYTLPASSFAYVLDLAGCAIGGGSSNRRRLADASKAGLAADEGGGENFCWFLDQFAVGPADVLAPAHEFPRRSDETEGHRSSSLERY